MNDTKNSSLHDSGTVTSSPTSPQNDPKPHTASCTAPKLAGSRWALVLGASSGFGEATCRALAQDGCNIAGVHLDHRAGQEHVESLCADIEQLGRKALFFNTNAADEKKRDAVLDQVAREWGDGGNDHFQVLFHSLAFGALLPFVDGSAEVTISVRQLEMTSLVMAHSLVFWTQALVRRGMMGAGGRIFAMTSSGATSVWRGYGAVGAAKAALQAYVRQLAVELAPRHITVNALCAGVTETPALAKVPDHEQMIQVALRKNPHDRLTRPQDVAEAVVALASPKTYWITGNVIQVDGGEAVVG